MLTAETSTPTGLRAVVEDELADGIIDDAAGEAGAQAQAREGIGDVVLAAADPDFEGVGEFDAAVARGGEADHRFAQGDEVELGCFLGFDIEGHESLHSIRKNAKIRGERILDVGVVVKGSVGRHLLGFGGRRAGLRRVFCGIGRVWRG